MSLPNRPSTRRAAALALLLAAAVATTGAKADSDHDRARDALQAGEVLPLKTVLDRVGRDHPGQVLAVELEREHGQWVYEVKLLQAGGRLVKLEVDARNGEVLGRRERNRDSDRGNDAARERRSPP